MFFNFKLYRSEISKWQVVQGQTGKMVFIVFCNIYASKRCFPPPPPPPNHPQIKTIITFSAFDIAPSYLDCAKQLASIFWNEFDIMAISMLISTIIAIQWYNMNIRRPSISVKVWPFCIFRSCFAVIPNSDQYRVA